jgi:hypothetical protein
MVTECEVTVEELSADSDPYVVVVPYSTCELEGWSVVQVIVADVAVMLPEITALIVGIVASVEKVKLPEVAVPAESPDRTAKS